MMDVQGKKVLVVGVARSGVAAARLLASRGAMVIANDVKPEAQIAREAEELRGLGVMLSLGGHPESLFENAELIVLSPGVPSDLAPLLTARDKGIEIISEPELAGRFLRGRVIGVTGSNGKTTTTTIIGELMRAAGADVIVGGNIGTPLTSLIEKSSDGTWTVAELSSFQLEMIESLRVNVAAVTNITPDHLDRHGTFENYVLAKRRIFMNQTADDWAVLNGQDQAVAEMARSLGVTPRMIHFSSRGRETLSGAAADIYVREGRLLTTMVAEDRGEIEVMAIDEIPLRGMHNVENVMTALASVFCAMGTRTHELHALTQAIKRFKGVEHRIEYVADIEGVKFYNDSKATNVDSTAKALEAFDRDVIVILGGKDKGSDYTALAPLIGQRVKRIVLIGAASDKIASQLEGLSPMTRAGSMQEAVLRSMEAAAAGDTVLLAPACASFDMFDNYEHRGRVFKEEVFKLAARVRSGWTGRLTT
ncbi:MAG TPA: UDP-N-acetylmuramoyl-L-alanine--D-glutamate ligase [Blastocatellia bacterium]|nr:UDP-N-acetylmuramoyl-L-alanine--D-glutamate ligase [Blastocatellia bacterium]